MIPGKVVLDTDVIDRRFRQVASAADDLSDAWPKVGKLFAARQQQIFSKGGRPHWKPLSPAYIVQRRRDGLGGQTLVRTGLLRDAVTQPTPSKSSAKYAVFGPSGRSAPHWTLHKHGTTRMPKRDPLPALNKAERSEVRDIVAEHIVDAWGGPLR